MKLLCFAHRGEAQAFTTGLEAIDSNYYTGKDYSVLITGEGIVSTLTRLPYYIAKYDISTLINLGVAGSLSKHTKVDNIYGIRTIYAEENSDTYFHSFTTKNCGASIDLITSSERIFTEKRSKFLSHFAHTVDREAWAIGKVAKEFKLPIYVYKIISDKAGPQTQCLDIKEKAKEYSQKLFYFYQQLNRIETNDLDEEELVSLDLPFGPSFTQQKRISNLLNKIDCEVCYLKNEFLESYSLSGNKKKDTNLFIQFLENKINPINNKIHKKLDENFDEFKNIGAEIKFDPKLDQNFFTLKMQINSQTNIENLAQTLKNYDYQKFQRILNGEIDV